MQPPPPDWPRLSTTVICRDVASAIDWYRAAFGFDLRLRVEGEGGQIVHCELVYGEAVVMVGAEGSFHSLPHLDLFRSPVSLGGRGTQSLMLYVDDVGAHHARASQHGAVVLFEPTCSDYGDDYWADKGYACRDPDGHVWYFAQRLRTKGQA